MIHGYRKLPARNAPNWSVQEKKVERRDFITTICLFLKKVQKPGKYVLLYVRRLNDVGPHLGQRTRETSEKRGDILKRGIKAPRLGTYENGGNRKIW